MILPDIKNGFIINSINQSNRWQCFIESCLIKTEDGTKKTAFLSSSCRSELISPNRTFEGPEIFLNRFADCAVAHTWKGPIMIRSGPGLYHPFRKKAAERLHYTPAVEGYVYAPKVNVKPISFKTLIDALCSEPYGRDNFLYMNVAWQSEKAHYSLICPCRYINFPNPHKEDKQYIQPISGKVLVEHKNRFYKAFVAAHVTEAGTVRTELCLEDSIPLFKTKKGISGKSYIIMNLFTAPFRYFLMTDEFCNIMNIKAKCDFFRY